LAGEGRRVVVALVLEQATSSVNWGSTDGNVTSSHSISRLK
jgi:hypothetical protein